jgi:Glyoxalase/Bleomycin resistance protein/Dioxygenase superfamily
MIGRGHRLHDHRPGQGNEPKAGRDLRQRSLHTKPAGPGQHQLGDSARGLHPQVQTDARECPLELGHQTDYQAWAQRLNQVRMPSSGPVDRFWFRSLYFREPNGILFEIATAGPGFATDESMDTLGEMLSLPPFLEGRRQQVEAGLKRL